MGNKRKGKMTMSKIPVDLQLAMYRSMLRIRLFEEQVAELDEAGDINTPCHYCIGQEAPPTGVCLALSVEDMIWGTHRSHGHYLAKGGDMPTLMAEIFCRATGCSSGRGGSMHICDPEQGMMGSVPIVAATIPLAVGGGLAEKLRGSGRVSVSFFGDGATEEGHFYESLNLAALQSLPVVFVCENNLYSSHMGLAERRRLDNICELGSVHGMEATQVDGNDVIAVYRTAVAAVKRARAGGGPTLIECRTFRWRGHVGPSWDTDVGVKRKDELTEWIKQDPIPRCADQILARGVDRHALDEIRSEVQQEIDDALHFALHSPFPQTSEVTRHVYCAH